MSFQRLNEGTVFRREGGRDVSISIVSINDNSVIAGATFDCTMSKNSTWLVVSNLLKNISQLG